MTTQVIGNCFCRLLAMKLREEIEQKFDRSSGERDMFLRADILHGFRPHVGLNTDFYKLP